VGRYEFKIATTDDDLPHELWMDVVLPDDDDDEEEEVGGGGVVVLQCVVVKVAN